MTTYPTPDDDVINSRDVIKAVEELEDLIADEDTTPEERAELKEELAPLKALANEASQYNEDWHHGETLIHDDYFENYARQFADDIGAIDTNASWPLNHIDWESAADELKHDYVSVEFGDETFWIHSI